LIAYPVLRGSTNFYAAQSYEVDLPSQEIMNLSNDEIISYFETLSFNNFNTYCYVENNDDSELNRNIICDEFSFSDSCEVSTYIFPEDVLAVFPDLSSIEFEKCSFEFPGSTDSNILISDNYLIIDKKTYRSQGYPEVPHILILTGVVPTNFEETDYVCQIQTSDLEYYQYIESQTPCEEIQSSSTMLRLLSNSLLN